MDHVKLFEVNFSDLGGFFDYEKWKGLLLFEQEQLLQNASKIASVITLDINHILSSRDRDERIFVGITNDSAINGCCTVTDGGVHLIAINAGLLVRLSLISTILFEVEESDITYTKNDKEWIYNIFGYQKIGSDRVLKKIKNPELNFELLAKAAERVKERSRNSVTAARMGSLISRIAFEFVATHELMHVALGHLNSKNPYRKNYNRLWESNRKVMKEQHLMFQGIESQSDFSVGVFFGRGFAKRTLLNYTIPQELNYSDHTYSSILGLAVKICFTVISFETSLLDATHKTNSHPHPELRFTSFTDGLVQGIYDRQVQVEEDWLAGIADGYWAFTNNLQKLQILEPIMWSLTSNMQAQFGRMAYSAEVKTMINSMRINRRKTHKDCYPYFLPFLLGYKGKAN